eukprot:6887319-Lingulodinium_polyedra.AAC.1
MPRRSSGHRSNKPARCEPACCAKHRQSLRKYAGKMGLGVNNAFGNGRAAHTLKRTRAPAHH